MLKPARIRNFSNLRQHSNDRGVSFLSAEIECKLSLFGPWKKIPIARRDSDYMTSAFVWHSIDPPLLFSREVAEYIYFLEQVYKEKEIMNATS